MRYAASSTNVTGSMSSMIHREPRAVSREEAARIFASGNAKEIAAALVDITFHDPDWRWLQSKCLSFTPNNDSIVRRAAITCLGHVARIHKRLDLETVLPVIKNSQVIQRLRRKTRSTILVCLSKLECIETALYDWRSHNSVLN